MFNEELYELAEYICFKGRFNLDDILYYELKSPKKTPITIRNLLSAFDASSKKVQKKVLSDFRIELELSDGINQECLKLALKNMYLKLIIANERKE